MNKSGIVLKTILIILIEDRNLI